MRLFGQEVQSGRWRNEEVYYGQIRWLENGGLKVYNQLSARPPIDPTWVSCRKNVFKWFILGGYDNWKITTFMERIQKLFEA